MKAVYFEIIMGIERLHRVFFDMVKADLDRTGVKDITDIQCFILYNIGTSKMTVGEISNRGYYMGSNVTYNLKKMVENGYVLQQQSPHDKRSSHIQLSEKGLKIFQRFDEIFTRQSENLKNNSITETELTDMRKTMQKLESFWRFTTSHGITF
jgi:DNA-binding MarR family transcriptional regulator